MLRSMFSGVSGSKAHQVRMDVIGDNIANINTIGFKAGRVTFQEVFAQTLRGGAAPISGGRGGIDPMQVGLGTSVRSIDTFMTQGNLEITDVPTDMAIEGAGFFVFSDGRKLYFTRDGAFKLDAGKALTNASTGYKLQGWVADSTGNIDMSRPLEAITIPLGQRMLAKATANMQVRGNLNASADPTASPPDPEATVTIPLEAFDSLGASHSFTLTFTKSAANEWGWAVSGTGIPGGTITGTITFDSNGRLSSGSPASFSFDPSNGAVSPQNVSIDLSALTQYASQSSGSMVSQDGFPAGTLEDFAVDDTGIITGIYSNGEHLALGQIALANFANPGGLVKVGSNMYETSVNSGAPLIGKPTSEGRGKVVHGALEMSNVDLAREFTDMIITQRGFQANSRIITVADEMLQDLLTLKR